jgi:hypothetical protein
MFSVRSIASRPVAETQRGLLATVVTDIFS